MASQTQPVTFKLDDYPGLDKAAPGDIDKLLRALNYNSQISQQAIGGLQGSSAIGDRWRLLEGPYPTPRSSPCLLVQNRIGNTWSTVQAIDPSGRLLAQQSWQTPTLVNSWVAYGSSYAAPRFYKDSDSRVWLDGAVKSGSAVGLWTFPTGYRPGALVPVMCWHDNAAPVPLFATIDSAGVFNLASGYVNTFVAFNGISFRAEN